MSVRIIIGDVREKLAELPDESVHCVVTSPPYFGLRDYGVAGQIGLEESPAEFVSALVGVFRDVRRVLRSDGTLWLNLGDSYAGHNPVGFRAGNEAKNGGVSNKNGVGYVAGLKAKDLIGIPWRVAFALQADGWYLRQDIIWSKPNPMPESVTDRCTKAHEYLFLLSKSARYHYDADAIAEAAVAPGVRMATPYAANAVGSQSTTPYGGNAKETRNKRSVWTVTTEAFSGAHFATFPPALIEPCILAACPAAGTVLDPFGGAGTTGLVADRLQRNAILIELNPEYADIAERRIKGEMPMFASVTRVFPMANRTGMR